MTRRLAALALAAAGLPGLATASPCGAVDAPEAGNVSAFEAAILAQEWTAIAPTLPNFPAADIDTAFAPLLAIGKRFTRCEVLFAETLPPRVHRRAVVFYAGDEVGLLLYADLMEMSGRTEVAFFSYNTSSAAIMELTR